MNKWVKGIPEENKLNGRKDNIQGGNDWEFAHNQ